jgi:hypothetical protein
VSVSFRMNNTARLLLVLSLWLWPSAVSAQVTVPVGAPASIAWDASPDPVTGYRCRQNGVVIADVASTATTCPVSTATAGTHTASVAAVNSAGESAPVSAVFMVQTAEPPPPPPPPPPTNPCVADPLVLNINANNGWPSSATGAQLRWTTNKPASVLFNPLVSPWKVTATDARGCTVVKTR